MKTLGEYRLQGPFDYEFDHNRNLRKILIDALKGLQTLATLHKFLTRNLTINKFKNYSNYRVFMLYLYYKIRITTLIFTFIEFSTL